MYFNYNVNLFFTIKWFLASIIGIISVSSFAWLLNCFAWSCGQLVELLCFSVVLMSTGINIRYS